jgi:hypothetical protein
MTVMETSSLGASAGFTNAAVLGLVVLLIWPLGMALQERRYIWAAVIFVFAPVGGIAWFIWRLATRSSRSVRSASHA